MFSESFYGSSIEVSGPWNIFIQFSSQQQICTTFQVTFQSHLFLLDHVQSNVHAVFGIWRGLYVSTERQSTGCMHFV